MSAIFGNLTNEGLEESQDRLGGFRVYDTDAYTGTIKYAYVGKSASSKARSVVIAVALEAGGEYREALWVTNKNDENFYVKDGKKFPLAGFTTADDLCFMTTKGHGLAEQPTEDKVINVWDADQKKEVPTSVPMLVNLLGQKVTLGILKELRNKQAKNGSGVYEDTPDTREENSIDKIFHFPSNLTALEAKKEIQNPAFYGAWVEQNRGKVRDRRNIKDGAQNGQAGRPGVPPKAGANGAAKTSSLFANS